MLSGRKSYCVLAIALCVVLSEPGVSRAGLVINLEPTDPPGTAPVMTGGGNLTDIMHAAAAFWMAAFPNVNWTLDIQNRWGGLLEALKAQFVPTSVTDGHIAAGVISFNNIFVPFYADPNPTNVAGYGNFESTNDDYNGNLLNVGRKWIAPVGSPAYDNLDLLMLAEHELGHALGLDNRLVSVPEIVISPEISPEFSGLQVLLTTQMDHIEGITPLLATGFQMFDGERKGISAVDILTIAEINGWDNPNLNPYAVPEPTSLALLLSGIVAFSVANATKRWMVREPY